MTISFFDPRYKSAFAELNLDWIREYFTVERKDEEQTSAPEEQILAPGGEIVFVVENDQVLGTCAAVPVEPGVFEIAKMAVRREARGRGIGHLLMKEIEKWITAQGAHKILILSNTVLEPAIALYLNHGFEVIHLGDHPDYERCNIVMEKHLPKK